MAEYPIFVFTALLIFGYGIFSKRLEKSIVSAPMVFVAIGLVAHFLPFPYLSAGINAPLVKILSELTLVIILFVDASKINLKELSHNKSIPARLLLIGLPLTALLGMGFAWLLFPGTNLWMLGLLALILTPTDAALGQAVISSHSVPKKVRQAINVESGLNDGIVLPLILICIAGLSQTQDQSHDLSYWGMFTLKQLVFGPLIGGFIGWAGGHLVESASRMGLMNQVFQRLSALSLALLSFSLAEMIHGNGFIAAFFAGLCLGINVQEIRERLYDFGESESQALVLFVFLVFGMLLIPLAYPHWDWRCWVYALLSLTAIRMVPVALSLMGAGLSRFSVNFIGWFGPRGIASILYLLLVVIDLGPKGLEKILSVVVLTVLLSVFAHGLSALPLSKIYQR